MRTSHRNVWLLPLQPHARSLRTSASENRPVLEKDPGASGRGGLGGGGGSGLMPPVALVSIYLPRAQPGNSATGSSVKTATLEKQTVRGLPWPLLDFQGRGQSRGLMRSRCDTSWCAGEKAKGLLSLKCPRTALGLHQL